MKHSETNEQLVKIEATEETKQALLELIDLKIEHDMEKILNKIDSKFDTVNNRIDNFKWTMTIVGVGIAIVGLIIKYG